MLVQDPEPIQLSAAELSAAPYPDYRYRILTVSGTVVGDMHLRLGNARLLCYEGNVGYYIYPAYRGKGYATAACQLLAKEAESMGITRLVITTNPDNLPSRRVCQKLGAVLLEEVRIPRTSPLYQQGDRIKCRYMWSVMDTSCRENTRVV